MEKTVLVSCRRRTPRPPATSWLVAMSAAANFPNWVMLERFVFRRDDEASFPDESKAPIRASSTTSWGAPFRVAFKLADAPEISRLYAQLPGFPPKQTPLGILATHHHLALFRVSMQGTGGALLQDFFIYDASSSSLVRLPTCTLPDIDEHTRHGRRRPLSGVECRRVMNIASMGILRRGEGEGDFAVAELNFFSPDPPLVATKKVHADIFWLRSSETGSDAVGLWNSARVAVSSSDKSDLNWAEFRWQTDTVIPAHNCLCWIDYYRGIVYCNLFQEPPLTLSFYGFPPDEFALAEDPIIASRPFYCCASAIDDGLALKIVRVIRHDGKRYGPLNTDASFTITCHTFRLDPVHMVWSKDYSSNYRVTSQELWSLNPPKNLPRNILMFPQVNIDRPHVVHFLIVHESLYVMKEMSVVTIDMNTRIAESCFKYINGPKDIGTEYAELMRRRSSCPKPFLPSEFSKFLHISGKRNV